MKQLNKFLPLTLLVGGMIGCGGSGGDDPASNNNEANQTAAFQSASVDASSYDGYTYFNIETMQTVALDQAAAAESTDWHIAFKRADIILNGGNSGSGNVAGALANAQDDFYDAEGEPDNNVFLNASADAEVEHLEETIDTTALTFISDELESAVQGPGTSDGSFIDGGWYLYNLTTHAITVNSDTWWLLRSAEGDSYSKFHASELTYSREAGLNVTFSFDVQSSDQSTFLDTAEFVAEIPSSGGESCFDFDSDAVVACDSASWDLKAEIEGRNFNLWTNSGDSGAGAGGAFGHFNTTEIADFTSATTTSDGRDISRHYSTDQSAGVFNENSWYAYNLANQHKLYPNYRTYVIDLDSQDDTSTLYRLQITSYYSDEGLSGHPSIRVKAE